MSRKRLMTLDANGRPRSSWEPAPELERVPVLFEPANPPGPIERRRIAPDVTARRPTRPSLGSHEHLQRSRLNGARRHVEVVIGRRVATPSQEVRTVSPTPATPDDEALPPTTYTRLAAAAMEAAEAQQAKQEADDRWAAARAALEAAWGELQGEQLPLLVPDPGPVARSGADHASRIPVSSPAKPRHQSKAGESDAKEKRAERVMAAMERLGGDQKAVAAELGMKLNAVVMVVKHARLREAQA